MSHHTTTVEVRSARWFDHLLEARQRVRALVIATDPEQATWPTGSNRPARPEQPDRMLALALMGVHDQLEATISGHIDRLREVEDSPEGQVVEHADEVMTMLEDRGAEIVPHLLDTDDNAGERLRVAIRNFRAAAS